LAAYATLQTPRAQAGGLFRRVLSGLSGRDYAAAAAAEAVPEAFGLAKTTVSRRFIRASAPALARLQERPLGQARWVAALVLDGKPFAEDTLVVALGVTATGEKRILGVVQAATENQGVCAACLRELVARGVAADQPRRVVRDGAKGLRAAVREVFGARAQVQRRQWHQRKNVVRYSPKAEKPRWHQRLQDAYAQPTYQETKAQGQRLGRELQLRHVSAPKRLAEGLKETLTLHRLVVQELRTSFKTTNLLESVNARVEARTARVTRWRTSDQKLPRMAAALLVIESRFRRVKGYRQLLLLERALAAKLPETRRRAA
jgi:transposase-like protein